MKLEENGIVVFVTLKTNKRNKEYLVKNVNQVQKNLFWSCNKSLISIRQPISFKPNPLWIFPCKQPL